ncbi:MAG: AzlC family transporter permease [Herminiimonas sp.]|nr:AzlC family transporter permease [Herminiimonas sp.]
MPGIVAWGVVTGMAMVKSGLTLWQALGMTFIVFGGSAQLAALPLIAMHSPPALIFLTALMVNLRFLIFSAAVAPHFAHLTWPRRVWYGYFNADVTMAFFPQRFPDAASAPAGKLGYFCGVSYSNWVAWQLGSVTGILLAGAIPDQWGIGFAGTLALLAITIPLIINLPALVGVVVASVVGVLGASFPYRLGLLLAIVLGMTAAMMVDSVLDQDSDDRRREDAA